MKICIFSLEMWLLSIEFNLKILQDLGPDTPIAVLKKAYRTKALIFHPDHNKVASFHFDFIQIYMMSYFLSQSPDAATVFDRIKKASEVLLNEETRSNFLYIVSIYHHYDYFFFSKSWSW